MRVLAVHTASSRLSIALVEGDRILAAHDSEDPRDHGTLLVQTCADFVSAQGIAMRDLDLMAAVTGPGSFTGIRIGLAAMRGFALASGVKLVGISSFDLYKQVAIHTRHRLTAIESWREELYFQLDNELPVNVAPADCARMLADRGVVLSDVTIVGDAAQTMANILPDAIVDTHLMTAGDAAHVALTCPACHLAPSAYYLREADVTLGKQQRVLAKEEAAHD